MNRALTSALILPWVLAGVAWAEQVAGYRRDGTGIYPEVKPPVKFSYPEDLRWETLLPGWGHGSPIVVGDKVYVMVEPGLGNCWPQLVALGLKTGKVAWKATLSTAEAAYPDDPARRAEAEKAWATFTKAVMDGYRTGFHSGGERPTEKSATAAKDRQLTAPLRPHGLTLETWHDGGCGYRGLSCVGQAYPTPCSDGEYVYVATAHGVFACFDLDGRRRWLRYVPGNPGEYCRNGRSPILYKNILISDITDKVRAFDCAMGKLLLSDDLGRRKHSSIVSPMVMTVGGKDILWAAGCSAYLLPDGKRLPVEGWKDYGMQTLVKHDERDVVFFCGAGEHCGWTKKGRGDPPNPPAAVRFVLSGDALKATVLWSGVNGRYYGGNAPWMLYDGGKLYAPGAGALDALTGRPVFGSFGRSKRGRKGAGPVPEANHLLQVAGGHVYGLGGRQEGVLQVCTLEGKPVSQCTIPLPEPTGAELELIKTCERQAKWSVFSKGRTFTFGPDCIVVRGMARLYCFGK